MQLVCRRCLGCRRGWRFRVWRWCRSGPRGLYDGLDSGGIISLFLGGAKSKCRKFIDLPIQLLEKRGRRNDYARIAKEHKGLEQCPIGRAYIVLHCQNIFLAFLHLLSEIRDFICEGTDFARFSLYNLNSVLNVHTDRFATAESDGNSLNVRHYRYYDPRQYTRQRKSDGGSECEPPHESENKQPNQSQNDESNSEVQHRFPLMSWPEAVAFIAVCYAMLFMIWKLLTL